VRALEQTDGRRRRRRRRGPIRWSSTRSPPAPSTVRVRRPPVTGHASDLLYRPPP